MKKIKIHTKGFVAGFLMCAMLSATIVWANPGGVMREVFYGVNIVVNGVPQNFSADMTPFISDGRTFLPVRGIAEVFDVPVEWYGSTQTVYIGTIPHGAPLLQAAPWFERQHFQWQSVGTANMMGNPYPNALRAVYSNIWSHHNLNGQFNEITGTIGRVDGSGSAARSISFIGDGRTLASFVVDGSTHPTDVTVDVTGVLVLRIETQGHGQHGARIAFANAMIQ